MIPPTTRWHEVMVNCAQGRSRSATFTIATPIFQGWGDSPRLGRKQRRPVVDGQTMYHSLIIVKKHLNQTKRALWYLVIQWKALVASHLDSNRALSKLKRGLQETMFFSSIWFTMVYCMFPLAKNAGIWEHLGKSFFSQSPVFCRLNLGSHPFSTEKVGSYDLWPHTPLSIGKVTLQAMINRGFFLCFHQLSPSATHKAYVMATCDVDVDEAYARVKKAGPALGIWHWVSGELRAKKTSYSYIHITWSMGFSAV